MNKKIALFFGGKMSRHLGMIRDAARKLGVQLDLISYNRVCFDSEKGKIDLRYQVSDLRKTKPLDISDYDVLFFRTTGKHWEEVNLIVHQVNPSKSPFDKGDLKQPIIVDPLVLKGRPSDACKAYQMLALKKAGIEVPKTVYGSLWYLYDFMKNIRSSKSFVGAHALRPQLRARMIALQKRSLTNEWDFPVIIKGSGGDRGTRVFKADNLEELEKLVRSLRKSETEEGRRYMLQEYIPNDGDYRVLVLGKKVLGVMKRSSQNKAEFKNNYSVGGKVEIAELPEEIKKMAVKAAEVCGLMVAGVDVMAKNKMSDVRCQMSDDPKDYVVLEVNKGPQFRGFMEATGIDVPQEIVRFLASLKVQS